MMSEGRFAKWLRESSMTNENESEVNSHETRNMWIAVAVIVVLLVGGMGINMLFHHDNPTETAQTSGSSQ